jgi:hypothetical protein
VVTDPYDFDFILHKETDFMEFYKYIKPALRSVLKNPIVSLALESKVGSGTSPSPYILCEIDINTKLLQN